MDDISEKEYLPREELEQLQLERLQQILVRVHRRVAYYRNLFNEIGFDPTTVSSIEDLKKIPFTTKETLRKAYPYEMFAVPLREVVRMHSTSGTTGKPIVVGYTKNDIIHWSELTARVLMAAGITKEDIIQICFPYGMFTGGLGFHYGAEKLGASVIPSSNAEVEHQLLIMRDYHTTVIICAPTFGALIADSIEKMNITPAELVLKTGLFGAEPWSEKLRTKLEENLQIKAFDNYGLTEIMGPGVSYECEHKSGLHISEDHFIPEIIDPETGDVLPPGQKGELVLTTLTKEGFPLIRYRTGDLTTIYPDNCKCGRSFVRMARVFERIDDMIILNGQNLFPSQFEQLLTDIFGHLPGFQLVIDRKEDVDVLEIQVELSGELFSDEMKKLNELREKIIFETKRRLDIVPKVKLVEPETIKKGMKRKKVIDLRENKNNSQN